MLTRSYPNFHFYNDSQSVITDLPLVTIGIPTYNRAGTLCAAIASARGQDYPNIELIISDDASTDGTPGVCIEACRCDSRVRYLRWPHHIGITENFRKVFNESKAPFFVWLCDDDVFEGNYVSSCMRVLTTNVDYALVAAACRHFEQGRFVFDGETIELLQDSAAERLVAFYAHVVHNTPLYGVLRRKNVNADWLPNTLGGDQLLMAAVAFKGKFGSVTDAFINRARGGTSKDNKTYTATLGISDLHARFPYFSIAAMASREIIWRCSAYHSLRLPARFDLAARVFRVFMWRYFWPYWKSKYWQSIKIFPFLRALVVFSISIRDKSRRILRRDAR
jgi:glycosyltransferase involved in cell wall biosynthesis